MNKRRWKTRRLSKIVMKITESRDEKRMLLISEILCCYIPNLINIKTAPRLIQFTPFIFLCPYMNGSKKKNSIITHDLC